MKLSKRNRIDTLKNEVRRRGNRWDKLIYFGLVTMFFCWVIDMYVGDLVTLRADGLVMRDRIVVATQFTAQITDLGVQEGTEVKRGQPVVTMKSKEVEETLAKLSSDIVTAATRRTALRIRKNVIAAMLDSAEKTSRYAHDSSTRTQMLVRAHLVSNKRVSEVVESEFRASQTLAEMQAEDTGIKQDLPQLETAITDAIASREQLMAYYAGGKITAPVDGIVGSLPVRQGSVVRPGEPLMELYTGDTYVLTYVPEGALYSMRIGDHVDIKLGIRTYSGHVARMFPVSSQLPTYFRDEIRPPARAQVMHITFDPGQQLPTLFAKAKITAGSWFPDLLSLVLGAAVGHGNG